MLTHLYKYYVRGWNVSLRMMLEIMQQKEATSELWPRVFDTLQCVLPKVFDFFFFCTDPLAVPKQ